MNRNTIARKATSCLLSATLVVGSFGAMAPSVFAGTANEKIETVYAITNGSGSQSKVTVSDHLTNESGLDTIEDSSTLKDISVIRGDSKIESKSGEDITWKADGKDVYYQGTTTKSVPVTLSIKYYLDGKQLTGKKLQGRSGDVKIVIDYSNTTGNVPFVALSGFMVSDGSFKNISINQGKVLEEEDKTLVVGMAVPGLAGIIGSEAASKVGFSDEVVIEGTAKDFAVTDIMTVVTSNFMEDLDTSSISGLDLDSSIDTLDSSAKKLDNGCKTLYEGLETLSDGTTKLEAGSKQLDAGANQLKSGATQLNAGLTALQAGLSGSAIVTQLTSLQSGVNQIAAGTPTLYAGLNTYKTAINNADDALVKGISEKGASVTAGTAATKGYADQTVKDLEETLLPLVQAGTLSKDDYTKLITDAKTTQAAAEQTNTGANSYVEGVKSSVDTTMNKLGDGLGSKADSTTLIGGSYALNAGVQQLKTAVDTAMGDTTDIEKSSQSLVGGVKQLSAGATQLESGATTLAAGMDTAAASITKLNQGAVKLTNGADTLSTGMSKFYNQGIKKLVNMYKDELKPLMDGLNSAVNAGKSYDTFTSVNAGTDGSVRFIYKTEITD